MFAFITSLLLFSAEAVGHEKGGLQAFYDTYLNYPGFEAWKFFNLAIFVAVLIYLLKKPLTESFKAKREAIRADLIKAEEEKQAALAELTSAEAKLVSLDAEKSRVISSARSEAEAEKARLADEADAEARRLREQTAGEIARLTAASKNELRKFSAEEAVRIAEEQLRNQMNADNDARLVKAGIQSIGGLN
jgi:F0F1-type ATP synthase membrane subunit b/b'